MPEYLNFFYIFNLLLLAIYPIIRNYGQTFMLNIRDTWGFKRESQIITGILTIILLRFVKYFSSWKKFIHEVFFYCKVGIFLLTLFIDYKMSLWYLFACIVVWLLFKPPRYKGQTNVLYIPNEEIFTRVIINNEYKRKDNIWFVIFYSNYSDDCLYTEELFAQISLKYCTKSLNFAKIDIDVNEELGKKYGVNTHRYQNIIPYIILFVNGKDTERFPGTDKHGNPLRVKYYREQEIVRIFNLEELKRKTSK